MSYRYERKYLVPASDLFRLRARIAPFVVADSYAPVSMNGHPEYTVRSIYFDSEGFDALHHKVEGLRDRWKVRVRAYGDIRPDEVVFLEVKRKSENQVKKSRTPVPYCNLQDALYNGYIQEQSAIAKNGKEMDTSFFYHFRKKGMRPTSLVVYDREPYVGKFDPDVRVTLDKNVRVKLFPEINDLHSDTGLVNVWKDRLVLEVKYRTHEMPSWIKSIIGEFELSSQALSKYAEAFYHKDVSLINLKMFAPKC